jgi:hypothetical protein
MDHLPSGYVLQIFYCPHPYAHQESAPLAQRQRTVFQAVSLLLALEEEGSLRLAVELSLQASFQDAPRPLSVAYVRALPSRIAKIIEDFGDNFPKRLNFPLVVAKTLASLCVLELSQGEISSEVVVAALSLQRNVALISPEALTLHLPDLFGSFVREWGRAISLTLAEDLSTVALPPDVEGVLALVGNALNALKEAHWPAETESLTRGCEAALAVLAERITSAMSPAKREKRERSASIWEKLKDFKEDRVEAEALSKKDLTLLISLSELFTALREKHPALCVTPLQDALAAQAGERVRVWEKDLAKLTEKERERELLSLIDSILSGIDKGKVQELFALRIWATVRETLRDPKKSSRRESGLGSSGPGSTALPHPRRDSSNATPTMTTATTTATTATTATTGTTTSAAAYGSGSSSHENLAENDPKRRVFLSDADDLRERTASHTPMERRESASHQFVQIASPQSSARRESGILDKERSKESFLNAIREFFFIARGLGSAEDFYRQIE